MLDSGLVAYAKCGLVGLVTGIGAALVWAIAEMVIPIALMMLRKDGTDTARGGLLFAESFGSISDFILPWIVGVVLGFTLMLRRQRRLAETR